MAKTASLTAGLVAKKGEAIPAAVNPAFASGARPAATAGDYFKALTVKLDKDRYMRLKQSGLVSDKSSQEIFVEALDAYLAQIPN